MTALKRIEKDEFLVAHQGPNTNLVMMVLHGNYMHGANPYGETVTDDIVFPAWCMRHPFFK